MGRVLYERQFYINLQKFDKSTRLIIKINSWLKYLTCAYYYLLVPLIDLVLIVLVAETNNYLRLLLCSLAFVIIVNLVYVTYILSLIARSAHYSYPLLNSCIARQSPQNVLNLRLRCKLLALIERLSGPVIGIYCYDLFPYTNHEFYIFCANCVKNFILLYGLTQ